MSKKSYYCGRRCGGATAATELRRIEEKTEINISKEMSIFLLLNCGLPYHIGGTIKEREKLLLQSPESIRGKIYIEC
jgi:NADPH-dependent 2,4-dienoyl-CoA reductase/sulfur reductase-like enzyme